MLSWLKVASGKMWWIICTIGAIALSVLYALFRREQSKRKEAELDAEINKANANAQEKATHALDYVIIEREKKESKINKGLESDIKKLSETENEILDDRLPDNVISMLREATNKAGTNKDS